MEVAELELAFADERRGGDRVDPALEADPHAALILLAGGHERGGVVALVERVEREVVGGRGEVFRLFGLAEAGGEHDLSRGRGRKHGAGHRGGQERQRDAHAA